MSWIGPLLGAPGKIIDVVDTAKNAKSTYDEALEFGVRKLNSEYADYDEFQEASIKKGLMSSKAPVQMGFEYTYSDVQVEAPMDMWDEKSQLELDIRQEGSLLYAHKLIMNYGISSLGEADKIKDRPGVNVQDGRLEITNENGMVITIDHGARTVESPMVMARGLNVTPVFENVPKEFLKSDVDSEFIIDSQGLYSDKNLTYEGESACMQGFRTEFLEFQRLRDSGSIAAENTKLWINTYPERYDYKNSVWQDSKLSNYSIPEESLDLLFEEMVRTPSEIDMDDKPFKGSMQTRDMIYGVSNYVRNGLNGSEGYRFGYDGEDVKFSELRKSKFMINDEVIYDGRDVFAELEEDFAKDAEVIINDRVEWESSQVESPILFDITHQKVDVRIIPPRGVVSNRPSKYDELLERVGSEEYVNQMFKAMRVDGFNDVEGLSRIPRLEQTEGGFNYTDTQGYEFHITESEHSISTGMMDFKGLSATPTFQGIPSKYDTSRIPNEFSIDTDAMRNNKQLELMDDPNVNELRMYMSSLERNASEGKMGEIKFKAYTLPRIYNARADIEDMRAGLTEYELDGDKQTINAFFDDVYGLTNRYRPDHAGFVSTKDVVHAFVNHIDLSKQHVEGYEMIVRNEQPLNRQSSYDELRESKLKVDGEYVDYGPKESLESIDGVAPTIVGMFSDFEIETSKENKKRKDHETRLNEALVNRENYKKLNEKYGAKANTATSSDLVEIERTDDYDLEL